VKALHQIAVCVSGCLFWTAVGCTPEPAVSPVSTTPSPVAHPAVTKPPKPAPTIIRHAGPLRAIWVTRYDYRSPADIAKIMENCRSVGLNAVLFQVRGNGTAFYRSSLEPWAEELGGRDPGYDPLAVAIQEAHARNIELHAWVNVMPGWRGPNPPADPRQLYNSHPEWFWYDQNGRRQPLVQSYRGKSTGWYVSVNPCLPEVRQYLVDVMREVVENYEIEGLHIDYIRFPNDATPRGVDYPRDPQTLSLYRQATGLKPESNPTAWARWRTDQVSAIVRDTRAMMRRVRPHAKLSASVGPDPALFKRDHYQDGGTWAANNWVDYLMPMNYTAYEDLFIDRVNAWHRCSHGKPVVVGIGVYLHKTPAQLTRQMDLVDYWGQGFSLFSYDSVFPKQGTRAGSPAEQLQARLRSKAVALLAEPSFRF